MGDSPLRAPAFPSLFDKLAGSVPVHNMPGVTARVWWPTGEVMATQVKGHLDAAAAKFLARSLRDHLLASSKRIIGFHDWTAMTDYDGDARILLTDAARDALPRSDGTHLLALSPLVAFGLRTVSVVIPKIFTYSSRAPFEAALATHLRRSGT